MSFSQSLISQQDEYVNFAPSWKAGIAGNQGFPKFLKNHNIETVNVIRTCEKLQLTLQDPAYFTNESQGHDDSEKQCAVRISNMPFRAITNIWFGTLKIYQQQVNNLFRLSEDLLIRSSKNEFNHLETKKRKSISNYNKLIKKPRLVVSNSTEKTLINSSYNQLLNEIEELAQESEQQSVGEITNIISNSRSVAHLQIRKFTICDISATTFTSNDIEADDSGFGTATHEEIVQFLNFADDDISNQNIINMTKNALKRKSTLERDDVLVKQFHYSHDFAEELISNENVAPSKCSVSAFGRFDSPNESSFFKLKSENKIETEFKENINHGCNNGVGVIKIKQEYTEDFSFENKRLNRKKTEKSKLIIDECIKIDVNEILQEVNKTKLLKKNSTRRLLKHYKIRRNTTALELLTTFNKRFIKTPHTPKFKICYSRQQFEKDYINLLRDIFQINYNQNLASVIYPKYLCSSKKRKQNKSPHLEEEIIKELQSQPLTTVLNNSDYYLNTVAMPFNNNEHEEFENMLPKENYMASINNKNEWEPYGVMMKLLNLWRCNQTTIIDSVVLFKLTTNRFEKALGFYSLLLLSKKHFVVLTTFPKTITLRTIAMGAATKCVIDSKK